MLDEPDSPQPDVASNDLPTPPRGRRAASRPAGPPDPVETAPPPAPEAPTVPEPPDGAEELNEVSDDDELLGQSAGPEEPLSAETEEPEPDETEEPERSETVEPERAEAEEAEPEGTEPEETEPTEPAEPAGTAVAFESELQARIQEQLSPQADRAAGESEAPGPSGEEDSTDGADDRGSEDEGDDDAETAGSSTRRRRRRRGGRRRRRSGGSNDSADDADDDTGDSDSSDSDSEESDDHGGSDSNGDSDEHGDSRSKAKSEDDVTTDDSGNDDSGNDDSESETTGTAGEGRRRRRRRRRRGEDTGGNDDPDTDVVVKVREPRRTKASDEITGIEGSTRLEAKRQRRKEGRAAGRRRTPILSEAEFLARRESVDRTMVIRQNDELAQIGVLEDGVLVEHYVDRASAGSLIGNVYLGRIQNVLPSMEAAFVDIGRGRNAVLYAGEVDWDSFGAEGQGRKIEKVLKSGQTVLVQVTKDPVGAKGARLTNHISLPGRYIVYSPGGHLSGISRKLPDTERKRLKEILAELIGDDASVIVRTAAEGSSEEELVRDVNRLKAQWEIIEKKVKAGQAPQQLYAEPDATVRIVRDLFTEDFSKLVIDGNGSPEDAYATVTAYVSHVAPHLSERIERWDGDRDDVFAAHRIDEQIAKALERKVFLPSGGSLIIDRTEAMTVIDVNTGKFTGSGGNLEATVTSNNLEAAEEVVRQLRLRDIGGIIVIDFIDMVLPSNRELLLRRLVECLGRDRTRHQVAEVTSLGLVQMTRKKIGTGLAEAFTETCECCKGRGYTIHEMPVESSSQSDSGDRGRRNGRRGGNGNGNGNGKSESRSEHGSAAEPAGD